MMIILSGICLAIVIAVVWVLGSIRWDQLDLQDPRKVFFRELVTTWKKPKNLGIAGR
jgi:hypothetical protein